MANKLKVFNVQDETGKTYKIEGPEDATDDELINALQSSLSEPEAKAPVTPAATDPVAPVASPEAAGPSGVQSPETVHLEIANATADQITDPEWLTNEERAGIGKMMDDPSVPFETINNHIGDLAQAKGKPRLGMVGSPEDLQKYRTSLAKGGKAQLPGYVDWKAELPEVAPTVAAKVDDPNAQWDEKLANEIGRGYEDAVQYGTPGFLARLYHDWAGTGMEDLKQRFPNATPEQLESLQEDVINYVQKSSREANTKELANDSMVPWVVGQVLGSAGVEDAIPGGEFVGQGGRGVAKRIGAQAAINTGADVGYQAADIGAGVQDGYNVDQTLLAPLMAGGLHSVVEGVGALARTVKRTRGIGGDAAPSAPVEITVPSARKNSKAYKAELAQSANEIVGLVQHTTKDWKNAPDFEVYDNFKKLSGVDDDAIGVTTPDGKVLLNAEEVHAQAQAMKVKPEDVVSAVTFHEALGHYGLAQKFGTDLEDVLHTFYNNGSSTFKKKVDDWLGRNPDAYKGLPDDTRTLRAAEEVLAEWSEQGRMPVTFVNKFTNMVKGFARDMGLNLQHSEREIRTILGMAHNAVINNANRDVSLNGFRYMNAIPNRELIDRFKEEGMGEMQAINRARWELFNQSSRGSLGRRNTDALDKYIKERVRERRAKVEPVEGERRKTDPFDRAQQDAMLEYAQAHQIRPSELFEQLERGTNPEAKATIDARAKQLAPEDNGNRYMQSRVDGDEDDELLASVREANQVLEDHPELVSSAGMYDADKAVQLMDRAEKEPGKLHIERMWPTDQDIVDFRYVDPETGKAIYGAFRQNGEVAENFEVHGEGRNSVGPKAVQAIRRQLKEQLPEIKKLEGVRVSGARHGGEQVPYQDGEEIALRYMKRREVSDETKEDHAKEILDSILEDYEPTTRSWEEAKESRRARGLTASQMRKLKGVGDLDRRLFQYDKVAEAHNERLLNLLERRDRGEYVKGEFAHQLLVNNELMARIFNDQAEVGRALNAIKALSFTKRKVEEVNKLLTEMHGNNMSAFASDDVFNEYADRLRFLLAQGNTAAVQNITKAVMKPYWWQYILSFRHAMMLSGLGTHAKNAADNAYMVVRELEEAIAASPGFAVRKMINAAGGKVDEGVSPQEVIGRLYGLFRAGVDVGTYKDTFQAFKEGHENTQVSSKIEMADAHIPGLSKVQDALHASDTFFRAFHDNANLYTLGVREARNQGFRGKAAFEEGSNLAANPTKDMMDQAKKMTDLALLVDKPSTPAAKLEAMKAIRPGMKAGEQATAFLANMILPFFRVTDRMLFQQLRRSPLAFVDRITREDLAAGGARMDTAIARMTYGSALLAYYWMSGDNGKVEGAAPKDHDKENALAAGGYLPNSVKDKGKYTDATALNLSLLPQDLHNATAANIATIREAYQKGENVSQSLALAAASLMSTLSSNSFAENITTYTEPFRDSESVDQPTAYANVVGGLATQFIPAIMRQYNQKYIDPVKRDTTGDKSFGDRVTGRIEASIPGLSDNLPVKYDVYGDQMQQGRSLSGMSNFQRIKDDEVSKELSRLERSTDKVVVSGAPSTITVGGEKLKLNADAKQEWQRVQGYYLKLGMSQNVQTDEWKKATDAEKIAIVKDIRKDAYQLTKDYMLPLLGVATEEEDTTDEVE